MLGFFSFIYTHFQSPERGSVTELKTRSYKLSWFPLLLVGFALAAPTVNAESLASLAARTHLDRKGLSATQNGDPIVIDQAALTRLASQGRIAAVGADTPHRKTPKPPSASLRRSWRQRYSAAAAKILKIQEKIRSIQQKIRSLQARAEKGRSGKTSFRIDDEIEVQRSRIQELQAQEQILGHALNHVIRQARKDGAQPGWFRDLPHP